MTVRQPGQVLCHFAELVEDDPRSFVQYGTPPRDVFIVRRADRVFAYLNICPHTSAPLDWLPDQFLNNERTLIQCAMHAALFQIEDGLCIAGPCVGARLTALPVVVIEGMVVLSCADV